MNGKYCICYSQPETSLMYKALVPIIFTNIEAGQRGRHT